MTRPDRGAARRIAGAIGVAAAFALGSYLLLDAVRPASGLVSFSFLLVLPAAICAFLSYVTDPRGVRRLRHYLLVPVWLNLTAIAVGAAVLREGVICILILSPLWLASGLAGAGLTWSVRRRIAERGRTWCAAWLAMPGLAMAVEPTIPLPVAEVTVERSTSVSASPARLWPLLRGIPDVRPGEGRWNLTQDVIGLPRPLGAWLVGEGVGAVRVARWGHGVAFGERVTGWAPGRELAWRFEFRDGAGWQYADRHLVPDSPYFRVTDGAYRIAPIGPGRVRLTLVTRYRLRTPVNAYSRVWGELFLGDIENNLLALMKGRAERGAGVTPPPLR